MSTKLIRRGFWVVPLSERVFSWLTRIAYRRTPLERGQKTETHRHRLFSFYLVAEMKALQSRVGDLSLPDRAMVIVFPFVLHGWTNEKGRQSGCFVYDLTPFHAPHVLY